MTIRVRGSNGVQYAAPDIAAIDRHLSELYEKIAHVRTLGPVMGRDTRPTLLKPLHADVDMLLTRRHDIDCHLCTTTPRRTLATNRHDTAPVEQPGSPYDEPLENKPDTEKSHAEHAASSDRSVREQGALDTEYGRIDDIQRATYADPKVAAIKGENPIVVEKRELAEHGNEARAHDAAVDHAVATESEDGRTAQAQAAEGATQPDHADEYKADEPKGEHKAAKKHDTPKGK